MRTTQTDNIGAAALLAVRGYKFVCLQPIPNKPRIQQFCFEDPRGDAAETLSQFFMGQATVQALAYDRAIAYLKHLLHHSVSQGGAR